jgi:hypothetical protein
MVTLGGVISGLHESTVQGIEQHAATLDVP